jgi:uncharacterized repeat protein (TIGR01451 family)
MATSSVTIFVANINIVGSTSNVTCNGSNDGNIVLTVNGGTWPYTFFWGNGSVSVNQSNLAGGTYTVTVTDVNTCTATAAFTITQPSPVAVFLFDSAASSCNASDGFIDVSVTGGVAPYSYLWSNGATTQNLSGLSQGVYTLTIVDANGCSVSANGFVSSPPVNLSATLTSTNIDCQHPVSNATLTIHGGNAPYYAVWADGTNGTYPDSVIHHTYTQANQYWIGYWDSTTAGCTQVIIDTILNNGIHLSETALSLPSCANPTGGIAKLTVTNAQPPLFFHWHNNQNGWSADLTSDTAFNLIAGNYSVTVTDSTGCTAAMGIGLSSSGISAYAYGTSASCVNGGVGSATISASGGTPPYTYLWNTTPPQTTQTATNIPAGNYSFTVTDAGGCSVTNSSNIYFSSYSFYAYTHAIIEPNCGNNNGLLTVNAYGGTPPYTYLWNDNQASQTDTALAPGTHTVTVTDAGGCTTTGTGYLSSSCYNTITGKVFNDLNGNCLFDSTDTYMQGMSIIASNGFVTGYGYSDAQGNYSIQVHDTGTFTLQTYNYNSNGCGNTVPCGTSSTTFHGFNNTATHNYGFVGSTGFNLATHPGWSSANPGFQKEMWILPFDQSVTPYTGNVTVRFVYDSNLIYQSSLPPLPSHNAATHTLTWTLTNVSHPNYDWNTRLRNFFMVPSSLSINYLLQNDFYITPTSGDCDTSDNHLHFSESCTGSHDPNEKTVLPAGNIYDEDSVLTYSIHFQNTGTDTTWFITVKDTLDAGLEPASVRPIASSHPYSEFNISGVGILTWVFNPIYLVDSATNENASKGFVTFTVKRRNNLNWGTSISNRASVYFDYAQPVLTNTVADTVAMPLYIFETLSSDVSVLAYPNPFNLKTKITVNGLKEKFDFSLFDVTGRALKIISSIDSNTFEITRDELSAGVYYFKISTAAKKVANGKLVVE